MLAVQTVQGSIHKLIHSSSKEDIIEVLQKVRISDRIPNSRTNNTFLHRAVTAPRRRFKIILENVDYKDIISGMDIRNLHGKKPRELITPTNSEASKKTYS